MDQGVKFGSLRVNPSFVSCKVRYLVFLLKLMSQKVALTNSKNCLICFSKMAKSNQLLLGKGSKWSFSEKQFGLSNAKLVLRLDVRTDLKLFISLGARVHGSEVKLFKIASFKGSAQNDELGNRANGSKCSKKSVKVFYIPKEREETSVPVAYTSKEDEGVGITPAIGRLFEKWLGILRSPSLSQVGDEEIMGEKPSSSEELKPIQNSVRTKGKGVILKAVWCHFLGLDATIKTPLLIFAPLYLAVNIIYGSQVSKELMPLWIFGPPAVVLYIKMLQLLWALYLFGFKQTVELIKNFPTYYAVASSYITRGKLKEDTRAVLFWPVISMKNLDYKKKMKELEEWLIDKYLDFVESIWPRYCGAIRFLKRANLI